MGSAMVNAVLVDGSDVFLGGSDRSAAETKQAGLWFEKEKVVKKFRTMDGPWLSLVAQKC
jgi:hypothetical protein